MKNALSKERVICRINRNQYETHKYNVDQPIRRIKSHTPRNKLDTKFIKETVVSDDGIKVTTKQSKQFHKQDVNN